jgi:hypothetical protein
MNIFLIYTCKIEKIGGQSGQSNKKPYVTKVLRRSISGQSSGQ